jgi:hypothetical protein
VQSNEKISKLGIDVLTKAKETQEKPVYMCKKLSVWNTILYAESVALAEAFSPLFYRCVSDGKYSSDILFLRYNRRV